MTIHTESMKLDERQRERLITLLDILEGDNMYYLLEIQDQTFVVSKANGSSLHWYEMCATTLYLKTVLYGTEPAFDFEWSDLDTEDFTTAILMSHPVDYIYTKLVNIVQDLTDQAIGASPADKTPREKRHINR